VNKLSWTELDQAAVDTARILAADAVEKVGNGHPGTAISLAPVAHLLYQHVMRVDPADPEWFGRDRFILSVGHSSLTQYVQLYLAGHGLELEDLKALRTWGSLTPGHPEFGHTKGVEITTGPLGQGLASAVGFAYASRFERGLFDPDAPQGKSPFDHHVYVIAGDGDLQEGVTAEASSLAGHQELGNLVVIYDSNKISIEDDTQISFSEDVAERYRSYGWHVQTVSWRQSNGYREDVHALYDAIQAAKVDTVRPSIIILETIIGWPSPGKQNSGKIHGSALGAEELAALKETLGFNATESFAVNPTVLAQTREAQNRGAMLHRDWNDAFSAWKQSNPERAKTFERLTAGELPQELDSVLPIFEPGQEIATRAASGKVINSFAQVMPELWGGSADLAESNNTTITTASSFAPARHATAEWSTHPYGRVLHFGIREHAMGAIINGIQLHGPTRSFGGTFLIFSDYMRPAVRLAALMNIPSIFVWTHDSIALGEDGPTHQPIEQLATLRAIPNLAIVRPADANEVAWTWLEMLRRREGPSGIALTRQALPVLQRGTGSATSNELAAAHFAVNGAYILAESSSAVPDVILIATGSEVHLAIGAREQLELDGIGVRVVSAPCLEWFAEQSEEYQELVLPGSVRARVSVEAGLSLGWHSLVGDKGKTVSIEHFGASADYKTLFDKFGMTVEAVVDAARASLKDLHSEAK
jgi:transketolase